MKKDEALEVLLLISPTFLPPKRFAIRPKKYISVSSFMPKKIMGPSVSKTYFYLIF